MTEARLKGGHVLAMFIGFFAVVIAANVTLAWQAIATFPGVEVANSYVASQSFDAERMAQQALGWSLTPDYAPGRLRLRFADGAGRAVAVEGLSVLIGRTTEAREDMRPDFVAGPEGYDAAVTLRPGKWMLAVEARAADGTRFHQRLDLMVRE
jgi:nitrogen fixation protein FixH